MALFGVFSIHSPEACPLNNHANRLVAMKILEKMNNVKKKYRIKEIVGFYASVLEHEFVVILDAQDAHDVEKMAIEVGLSKFNTLKIVPLNEFAHITKMWKGMEK
ncbi:MAG TPA: hypothetical protein VLB45_01160 [Nitrosopumilaceae archaeon]|nr:hypothetical protein [Nitrosopumilaceae archaeon]